MHFILLAAAVALMGTPALAQSEPATITVFAETRSSSAQESYVENLAVELRASGFELVVSPIPWPLPPGEVRNLINSDDAALGLVFLQSQIGEGDTAAALLSSPGAFATFDEQRAAQQGVIGDIAREEIAGDDVFALRLWPHSTDALISNQDLQIASGFQGSKIITGDPLSIQFAENLGAFPMQIPAAEVYTRLQVGVADSVVVSQSDFEIRIHDLFVGGTIVPDYKFRTAVTLSSVRWWNSLTAADQRHVLRALDRAEEAAAAAIQAETELASVQSEEMAITTVSWPAFSTETVREAVRAVIAKIASADPDPILQLRDHLDDLASPTEFDENILEDQELQREGALHTPARVFFASDRRYDSGLDSFTDRFANVESPSATIHCGELASAEMVDFGDLIGDITLAPGSTLAEDEDCVTTIVDAVVEAGGSLLIYVHGYRNSFDQAVRRGLAFARDAGLEGVLLIWSWPSGAELGSYGFDEESIIWTEPHFYSLATDLFAADAIVQIDFIAHSMGTRLVAGFMRDRWPGQASAVVLASADLSRPILKQAVERAPSAAVTLLSTEADRALLVSRNLHKRPRAGRAKPLFLLSGMDTIDLSAFDRWFAVNHRHAFSTAEVISDLSHLYRGKWRAVERGLDSRQDTELFLDYYVIVPDKS